MEIKTCKVCGRELPSDEFNLTKSGTRVDTCKACVTEKRLQSFYSRKQTAWGGNNRPFSDSDFDGREPREVLLLMGRAKRWLESRGFTIQLSGEYRKVEIKKVKFE